MVLQLITGNHKIVMESYTKETIFPAPLILENRAENKMLASISPFCSEEDGYQLIYEDKAVQ